MEKIHNQTMEAVSSIGRDRVKQIGKNVFSHRNSIQGEWTESLWYEGPSQELEKREPIPQKILDMDQFKIEKPERTRRRKKLIHDTINKRSKEG